MAEKASHVIYITRNLVLLAMVVISVTLCGCAGSPGEPGTLEGTVTIGPIWPVEPPGGSPPVPCEVYQARKIMVYDERGSQLVSQVDIDCQGHYRALLKPGPYTVDINHLGIDHSPDVPKKIAVKSGETIRLDIDIDTGIR
jgi:hypothetical protein